MREISLGEHPARTGRQKVAEGWLRRPSTRAASADHPSLAIDLEAARSYAENRLGAAVAITVLALLLAATSTLWVPASIATLWLAGILACHAISVSVARAFVEQSQPAADLPLWKNRFIAAELLLSAAWVALAIYLDPASGSPIGIFCCFVLLTGIAASAALASSIRAVMWAGMLPIIAAATLAAALRNGPEDAVLAVLACGAGLYFASLSGRLLRTRRNAFDLRREKDALIAELEEARANSDEARRRAEDANLAKSRFLATMSHELRTPLNAILGFSEIMKDEVLGSHRVPAYRNYAADIHASGEHLLDLINEILDLSRIEAGRYELAEASLDLADVALDCRRLLAMRAQTRSLGMTEAIEQALPPLWADEKAIRQICLNLMSNAIKFTPEGGEVVLKIGWTASGGQYLSIRDTGPGIPADEIATVLTSFGQGSLAMKTAERGAGLGLPIVRGLVELHGGVFTLRSKLCEGTEVIVTFPPDRVLHGGSTPRQMAAVQKADAAEV